MFGASNLPHPLPLRFERCQLHREGSEGLSPLQALPKPRHRVSGTVPFAQRQPLFDGGGDEFLRLGDGFPNSFPCRQTGGDCRRKNSPRPVRVLRLVAGRPKLHELRPVVKQIYRLSAPFQMTALDDHALRPEPFDGLSGLAHVG